jgi:hypothetical protein
LILVISVHTWDKAYTKLPVVLKIPRIVGASHFEFIAVMANAAFAVRLEVT